MAYPMARSMNSELAQGLIDGKYKKVINDRGGVVEHTTQDSRVDLHDLYYGIHETPSKELPDGRAKTNPYYVPTRPVNLF